MLKKYLKLGLNLCYVFGGASGTQHVMREFKDCPICKLDKPASEFHKCSTRFDGLDWCCKACKKAGRNLIKDRVADKARYLREPEKARARAAARAAWHQEYVCSVLGCGLKASDLHHLDYSKPLDVVPLCKDHHKMAHS